MSVEYKCPICGFNPEGRGKYLEMRGHLRKAHNFDGIQVQSAIDHMRGDPVPMPEPEVSRSEEAEGASPSPHQSTEEKGDIEEGEPPATYSLSPPHAHEEPPAEPDGERERPDEPGDGADSQPAEDLHQPEDEVSPSESGSGADSGEEDHKHTESGIPTPDEPPAEPVEEIAESIGRVEDEEKSKRKMDIERVVRFRLLNERYKENLEELKKMHELRSHDEKKMFAHLRAIADVCGEVIRMSERNFRVE